MDAYGGGDYLRLGSEVDLCPLFGEPSDGMSKVIYTTIVADTSDDFGDS